MDVECHFVVVVVVAAAAAAEQIHRQKKVCSSLDQPALFVVAVELAAVVDTAVFAAVFAASSLSYSAGLRPLALMVTPAVRR